MNKIVGLISTWGSRWLIESTIKQALYACDEVIVCVGSYTEELEKLKDDTKQFLEENYSDRLTFVPVAKKHTRSETRCATLNAMLKTSELRKEPGNWIWLLDDDEFYLKESIDKIKKEIYEDGENFDWIQTKECFYYYNLNYYLRNIGGRKRVWKIKNSNDHFRPTNQWSVPVSNVRKMDDIIMNHLSFLVDFNYKESHWRTEYHHHQNNKLDWIKNVYLKFSLERESEMLDYCEEKYGLRNLYHPGEGHIRGDEHSGKLIKRDFQLPEWIRQFENIEDFRKRYSAE